MNYGMLSSRSDFLPVKWIVEDHFQQSTLLFSRDFHGNFNLENISIITLAMMQ
jgi:hypothetical protein